MPVQHVRLILSNKLDKKLGGEKLRYMVKEIREELGVSQEVLAKKAGVSRTIISGLESGKIKETSTVTLSKIANALGKKVGDIFLD